MPNFSVQVPHDEEPAIVAERLREFSQKVRSMTTITVTEIVEVWDEHGNLDFSFKAMGFSISGRMESRVAVVHVQGSLPFAALPFRGAIEREVAAKIREAIS
ncbi:MAG: polyhydroxyalkanoic acid system family protein [Pirellulaceae bacterium]|nr:polyhydroxyalkanoic acid system family protein [Pirellulaceae bacterium]